MTRRRRRTSVQVGHSYALRIDRHGPVPHGFDVVAADEHNVELVRRVDSGVGPQSGTYPRSMLEVVTHLGETG